MLHQIGIGTLGPVFRTYEPTRDRLVAVKAFRLDIVPEQAQALAAALSRAAHASLFHPSIVEPIEAGVEGTVAFRAEEYVAAESLDVAMRHYAPAAIEKVLPFITQLAGAIDFARAAGIGHGGLHPRDIFVTPDEARATGFGVVEGLEQVGIRAPIRRPYSAPERIAGGAWSTPADVFSLAAIAFELLTARRPAGTGAQIGALSESDPDGRLHAVLARAMDDEPSRRYATALAFAGALEAAARGEAPAAATSLPPTPDASLPLAAAALAPAAADVLPPTPGEFAVEQELDPVHQALEDAAAAHPPAPRPAASAPPSLFDDAGADERPDAAGEARADVGATPVDSFAEEFLSEEGTGRAPAGGSRPPAGGAGGARIAGPTAATPDPADRLSPIEDEPAPMLREEAPMLFEDEPAERSRSAVLPYALVLVAGLLPGFAAGYFVGSRDRLTPASESASASPSSAPPSATQPTGAATSDKPGQYSEQKVARPGAAAPGSTPSRSEATPPAAARSAPPSAPIRSVPPPMERTPAPARRGQIVVRSQPSRANVTINGKWRGRTPITVDDLPFGTYSVRVVQPGFIVARDEFTLSARTPARTYTARLERAAKAAAPAPAAPPAPAPQAAPAAPTATSFTGSLYVDSRPRGATVLVDGRSVGQTPVSVPEMRVGTHVIRMEMNGKKPWTSTTRIVAGRIEHVAGSLEDK